jgi:sugar phosphate isomerase/epimerase
MASLFDIRIGTMVGVWGDPADYIRQILPHGFESFALHFGGSCVGKDLPRLAAEIREACGDQATISAIGVYGNPLESTPKDLETRKSWELLIDNAHLFGTDVVSGFTGRLRDKALVESLPCFKEVFGALAKRAEDKGVRLAFENCPMGGTWETGDWNIAINPSAWEMMFNAVPSDALGLEWEPAHQLAQLMEPLPQLRTWTPKIFHLHGKDASVKWDVIRQCGVTSPVRWHFDRTPGFGDSNWTDIISDLRRFGFTGAIDIEGWHDPVYRGELEMTGQVRAMRYLKECRGGTFVQNPQMVGEE